tara:strand:+ start:37 stop:201 length:165 start_codon:yes stop_codon:yes gene_type:complete
MAYMNIGDPIQENFQRSQRVGNVNKRAVWKKQKRRKVEESKRKSVKKLKPRKKK